MKTIRAGLAAALLTVVVATVGCRAKHKGWPASMETTTALATADRVRESKGKVVLFVLYASWCKGCRAELPAVERMRARYAAAGLVVLAFSLDEDPVDYGEMLDDVSLGFALRRITPLNSRDLAFAVRSLGGTFAQSIPYTAVFDRGGKLVGEWSDDDRTSEIEAKVKLLL